MKFGALTDTALFLQTVLFDFLPQSEDGIQKEAQELYSHGTNSLLMGMIFSVYYLWVPVNGVLATW